MSVMLEDDGSRLDTSGVLSATWAQESVVDAGSGNRASGRTSDISLRMSGLSSRGCATTWDCCITVEGVTFDGESPEAAARELEE